LLNVSQNVTDIQTAVNAAETNIATNTTAITSEVATRAAADTTLQTNITTETTRATGVEAIKANDSAVVHNTGNETVGGIKTFSSAPIVPSSSFPESATANLTADLAA